MKWNRFLPLAAAALLLGGAAVAQGSVEITGAGSTFINPAMQKWTTDFHAAHPHLSVNYQSLGSGAGVAQVKAGTVDFGASDYAQTDQQLASLPPVVQIPESAGPVCITYHLPGLQKPLRLTAKAVAGIYLGSISKWNDPEITASNPGVSLPGTPIIVASRSDGSGTTAIFTTYLSAVSPAWKSKVGAGPSVKWPVGLSGKGNEGVAGIVENSSGSIGYVELAYANASHLPVADIQNSSGHFIAPSGDSTSAAIDSFRTELAKDVRIPIVNASGPAAYPIAGLTYLIVPKDGPDMAKRQALKAFIEYILSAPAQDSAKSLNYAPIPASILKFDHTLAAQLLAGGKPLK